MYWMKWLFKESLKPVIVLDIVIRASKEAEPIIPIERTLHFGFQRCIRMVLGRNSFSSDETSIYERPVNPSEVEEHMNFHIDRDLKRIVFAHEKDRQGKFMYQFKGEYEIDEKESRKEKNALCGKESPKELRPILLKCEGKDNKKGRR